VGVSRDVPSIAQPERNDDDGKRRDQPVEQARDPVVTERFP
jgi:hypothetical protein